KAQAARDEATLKDWPALARYRESNAKAAPPSKNENRVVFMGDSITDGWDDPRYGGFFPGKPYIDRGISGQTTPQMLIRFRPDVIALRPKVVVILAGTNDIAGNTGPTTLEAIEDNLASMSELARADGIRVVLSSLLPVSDYEKRDGKPIIQTARRPPAEIRALNEWMRNYAAARGETYLDYFSAMADKYTREVSPRAAGNRAVPSSLLPASHYEKRDGKPIIQTARRPPAEIRALNEWMRNYAAARGETYLDYFSAMADK